MTGQSIKPLLFVISGPSGSGKGTAMDLLASHPELHRVATYTTREPRPGERNGVHYRFIGEERFEQLHKTGEIWEVAQTYGSRHYGSPRELLSADSATPLLVELEPNGYLRVRASSSRRVVGIFVMPPSRNELARRLKDRATDADIASRLSRADHQVSLAWTYDYFIVNDDPGSFANDLLKVVDTELTRTKGADSLLRIARATEGISGSGGDA